MNINNFKFLYQSFDFKGKISFLFNSLQSVFADLFYGFIYFLIFEKLIKKEISLITIFFAILLIFIYFIFIIPIWGYFMEKCRNVYFKNLSNIVFEKIFKFDKNFHSSELVYLLQNDIYNCSNMASWSFAVLFQAIFSGLISTFIIGKGLVKIIILLYIFGIFPIVLDIFFSKYIRNKYIVLREDIEKFRKNITEYSNNIIVANIYNISKKIESDLNSNIYKIYKLEIKLKFYDLIVRIINRLVFNFSFKVIIIVYGMKLVLQNEISFGYLILSLSMVEGIIFFLSYIGQYLKNLQKIFISFQKINAFLNVKNRYEKSFFENREISNIKLSNVTFGYNKNNILDNFNCNFKFPNNYILTGENGKGKSTIFKLIFGYLKSEDGNIEISYTENLKNYPVYISQDTLIFEGSIYENLSLGESISLEEIEKSLYCVKLDDWFKSLENNLEYKIENNGENLSKGQKMRFTIAKALIKNPQILFLDEPDANLDKKTILTMFERIQKNYSCNFVIITHKKENFYENNWEVITI